jgi:SAM-dependent methyltransferase
VAPERGLSHIILKHQNIEYITADLMADNVMVQMDITDIEYPSDTFDVIICNHVLEHVVDDKKAMSELYRVMKPGGWGILQVPIALALTETYEDEAVTEPLEREALFGQADHVRIYALDYAERLKEAGFEVEVVNWQEDAEFISGNNKYGLLPLERIYVVKKLQATGEDDHV